MTRIPIDPDVIRMLAAVLVETGLSEIEIAEKDTRIRVVRAPSSGAARVVNDGSLMAPPEVTIGAGAAPPAAPDFGMHPGAVTSPMVGVVYLAPEPGAPPFVSVGQSVAAGQTLLLIEAMKTFNQIKAPKAGTVARVLVSNGTPVEYGEAMMILEN